MSFATLNGQSSLPLSDTGPARPNSRKGRKADTRGSRDLPRSFQLELIAALSDPAKVLFLDVETTGLSWYYDEITLVGWLVDGVYRVYIAGDDPKPLLDALRAASTLVTFNGKLFDTVFLRKAFHDITLPKFHADLRYLGRRAGLNGGQKAIENALGIEIRKGLEDLDGAHAVLLWYRYLRGDVSSLRRLIDYNRCDVAALRHILDKIIERLITSPDFWSSGLTFSKNPYAVSGWASPECELPQASRLDRPKNTFRSLFCGTKAEATTVVGIDLTGSEDRPSGWCVLRGEKAETEMVSTDEEIVARILSVTPALVSIDSPLSIPFGRTRVEDDDPARTEVGIMRRCERELKRRGINVYPCLLPSMQGLTRRGMRLAARLRGLGFPVIESYPGAAQDIIGIPRKGAGEDMLKQGLADFGIRGAFIAEPVRHDELDAVTSALVGSFFLAGKYEALASPSEDPLIIPDLKATPGPLVVGISGRIAAGKTTTARILERQGFAYTRFSLIVDEEIRKSGAQPDRSSRQRVGLELNLTKGQRWLCERALARAGNSPYIVVDGMRFLEDRSYFVERFGARFLHLHVVAPPEVRRERYIVGSEDGTSFEEADSQAVEAEVDRLGRLASMEINNVATIDALSAVVEKSVLDFARRGDEQCRSRSS
jgi:predicted nuclease with RNAse H fold/dephospho-CoA kinase